jgi:ATP-dependent helicase/nuclease subunit A
LLQGVIDLVILGDKNILVDYKTTKTQTPEQLVEKYDLQMKLYKLATEYATGKPIDQVYIYSFYHNKLVKVF